MEFIKSKRGQDKLNYNGYSYVIQKRTQSTRNIFWRCTNFQKKCPGRMTTCDNNIIKVTKHNHIPQSQDDDKLESTNKDPYKLDNSSTIINQVIKNIENKAQSLRTQCDSMDDDDVSQKLSLSTESSYVGEEEHSDAELEMQFGSSEPSSSENIQEPRYQYYSSKQQPHVDSHCWYNDNFSNTSAPVHKIEKDYRLDYAYNSKIPDYGNWTDPNELVDRLRLLMMSGDVRHQREIHIILDELRKAGYIRT